MSSHFCHDVGASYSLGLFSLSLDTSLVLSESEIRNKVLGARVGVTDSGRVVAFQCVTLGSAAVSVSQTVVYAHYPLLVSEISWR
jgi:hypothetical protein